MKLMNDRGQAVYLNCVEKSGAVRYIVKAASGQYLLNKDKKKVKSRSFQREIDASRYLKREGYR